jgi:hypothetical protein
VVRLAVLPAAITAEAAARITVAAVARRRAEAAVTAARVQVAAVPITVLRPTAPTAIISVALANRATTEPAWFRAA